MQVARLPNKIKRGMQVYINLYLRHQTPVLVYSTGRVGSMALHHALEQHGLFAIQVHTLNQTRLIENRQPGSAVWAWHHVIKPGRQAKIITPVRDPVALMVSDFFPKLRWITGQENAWEQLTVDELCNLFNTRYFEDGRHLDKLNWFEDEMLPSLGIDVYQYPPPRDLGYATYTHAPYDLLVIKTELQDEIKAQVVGDFVGVTDFAIPQRNVGETKTYGKVYKTFKQQLAVRQKHLDVIYQSRYACHFYTPVEIDAMISRWRVPLTQR